MIKKAYVNPETKVTVIECQAILAGSGGIGFIEGEPPFLDHGIGFGGDDTGLPDAAKGSSSTFWDEE